MDLRQLAMFRAVFNTQSITHAAEKLYVTPAAISLQMKALAEELHTDLFVRADKKFVPTPAARYLASQCLQLFAVLDDIQSYFQDTAGMDRRPFVLGTGLTTLLYKMGNIRSLRREFPNNEIRVFIDTTEKIIEGLRQRTCDLGVVTLAVFESDIRVVPLFTEEFLLVRPGSSKHHQAVIRPAELAKLPLILYPKSNIRTTIDQFIEQLGIQPRVVMEIDSVEVIKKLVESGFGSAFLPEGSLRSRSSRFSIARVADHRLTRTIALATLLSGRPRKLTDSVAAFLQARMASKP